MTSENHVALLIDADNNSADLFDLIFKKVSTYGKITIKRIYGDFTSDNLKKWNDKIVRNAIKPIQRHSYSKGKNSSDIALVIDVMDLLHTKPNLCFFCIVSKDGDFANLATRIREEGKFVLGIGTNEKDSSDFFQRSCDEYLFLESLEKPNKEDDSKIKSEKLLDILKEAYDASIKDDDFVYLSNLGTYLKNKDSSINPTNYGFKNWSHCFETEPYNQYFKLETLDDNKTKIVTRI